MLTLTALSEEIQFERRGAVGYVLLNRPKALNALTLSMCKLMTKQLMAWAEDEKVKAVVVRGAGERAFCAGGDIVRLYQEARSGSHYAQEFWTSEYRLNTLIKRYPKPYVALMNGVVMGGGVGVSVHGSHRVVTDQTLFAMPEASIGIFPDAGGGYFLPRTPGYMGMFLGLTGKRLNGADCVALGFADVLVPHDALVEVEGAVTSCTDDSFNQINQVLRVYEHRVPAPPVYSELHKINAHFGHDSIEQIIQSLRDDGGTWAAVHERILRANSPTSLKITFRQIREGSRLSFEDCMKMEWRIANRCIVNKDFFEGVRAILIDKDNKPQWSPATLEEVSDQQVAAYVSPLTGKELDLSSVSPL